MRIVAGEFKGRKLNAPADNAVRPTTDMVKEAMFSIIMGHIEDAYVCDLFAGTGNLGLEALSRGADKCIFGDHARSSIKIITDNVALCRAEDRSEIVQGDFLKVLDRLERPADIFLLDPPYKGDLLEKSISAISSAGLLAEGGVIIAEHDRGKRIPDMIGKYEKIKEKRYGRVVLSIFM